VAEILIFKELLCRKKDALLILPYISLVQEKVCIYVYVYSWVIFYFLLSLTIKRMQAVLDYYFCIIIHVS